MHTTLYPNIYHYLMEKKRNNAFNAYFSIKIIDLCFFLKIQWRGKWQAGIRCARSDWPLSTIRAKPTHERKQYLVIFFPRKRNYSWADVLLLRPINEFPEPIAYRSHNIGVKIVKDLIVARRFIMQKIAVTLINTIEQLTTEVCHLLLLILRPNFKKRRCTFIFQG